MTRTSFAKIVYRKVAGPEGQKHVHVYDPNGKEWSQNEDGSQHDKHRTEPGDPPKWVRKKLKEKARWDWDGNKMKATIQNIKIPEIYPIPVPVPGGIIRGILAAI